MNLLSLLCMLIFIISEILCARILVIAPFPSISHQVVFKEISKKLTEKKHEVYFITTNPSNKNIKNLTEIDISANYEIVKENDLTHSSTNFMPAIVIIYFYFSLTNLMVEKSFKNIEVQELFKKDSHFFDLLIVEAYHPAIFAIQSKFHAPLIGVTSTLLSNNIYQFMGSFSHAVLYPDLFSGYETTHTFWERVDSTSIDIFYHFALKYAVYPNADKLAKEIFGNDIPYIENFMKNSSIIFVNSNRFMSPRKPLPANIIEVGGIHIPEVYEPLSKDLKEILDKSTNGVIYFSLGTNVRLDSVGASFRQIILDALRELPYTVLCKWQVEGEEKNEKNIIFQKWFPQISVLAHPNVKVFVTQGGIQSADETLRNGVPVVVIPFLADQPKNARSYVEHRLGLSLNPYKITKELLRDTILEVAENKTYKLNAIKAQKILKDEPMTATEKIVWWCEYVMKHDGAHHLRSRGNEVPMYQYLFLDVMLFFIVNILAISFVLYQICKVVCFRNHTKQKTE